MDNPFSDVHEGKPIVTYDGHTIGTVREVLGDRATVERTDEHDSLTDEIKEQLEWDDEDQTHELRREHVDRYEDDTFHIRRRR